MKKQHRNVSEQELIDFAQSIPEYVMQRDEFMLSSLLSIFHKRGVLADLIQRGHPSPFKAILMQGGYHDLQYFIENLPTQEYKILALTCRQNELLSALMNIIGEELAIDTIKTQMAAMRIDLILQIAPAILAPAAEEIARQISMEKLKAVVLSVVKGRTVTPNMGF